MFGFGCRLIVQSTTSFASALVYQKTSKQQHILAPKKMIQAAYPLAKRRGNLVSSTVF